MKKRHLKAIFAMFLLTGGVLAGCSNAEKTATTGKQEETKTEKTKQTEEEKQEINYGEAFKEAVTELAKANEGQNVDFDKVMAIYTTKLQPLVQKRDAELQETVDQHLTTALNAGKDGSIDKVVVEQIFDKLMQKVFYTTIKQEFTEIEENWNNKDAVKEEVEEAKEFYKILQPTVEKRDAAYGTTLVDTINGGFSEIESAVEKGDTLAFALGKQVIDKTLMKTFYLATGALPYGYATKAAAEAKKK